MQQEQQEIQIVLFPECWAALKACLIKKIYTKPITNFMATIGWYYDQKLGKWVQKKHAKNSVKWIQKFLNGDWLERAFKKINEVLLTYIGDDHHFLKIGSTGKNDPDFKFTALDGKEYTLDTKTSINVLEKYDTPAKLTKAISSFHKANYVCMFCMTTRKFYWFYKIVDSYSYPCLFNDLPDCHKEIVKIINLPDEVEMITFEVNSEFTDEQLPEVADYHFTKYNVIKN